MYAKLENSNHILDTDNPQMINLMKDLKKKHEDDEITAEIKMSGKELKQLNDSLDDSNLGKRQSLITYPRTPK